MRENLISIAIAIFLIICIGAVIANAEVDPVKKETGIYFLVFAMFVLAIPMGIAILIKIIIIANQNKKKDKEEKEVREWRSSYPL